MSNIVLNPNKGSGGLVKSFNLSPYVKLADNLAIGMSKDDSDNDAQGTLYPTNIPLKATGDSMQSIITTLFNTEARQFYPLDDQQHDIDEVKTKVAERFFTRYKKLVALLYASFTSNPRLLATSTATIYQVYKVEWLDATRFAMLYLDQTTIQDLRLIVGQIGTNGLVTWGSSVQVKQYTDSTHTSYGHMGMSLTDTDKLLICYTNKVSTNYWLKGRVAAISGTTITLHGESSDLHNFGTSAPGSNVKTIKIRGSAGAGAMAMWSAAAAGTTTMNRIVIMQHDGSNTVTAGVTTVADPSGGTPAYLDMYCYATDKIVVAAKVSASEKVYGRIYTISGTTPTAVGASPLALTSSSSNQHYLANHTDSGFINFGSNILGLAYQDSNTPRVMTISVASDTLSIVDDGSGSTFSSSNTADFKAVTLGDNTGLIYHVVNSGGNLVRTSKVRYVNGKASVADYVTLPHDMSFNNIGNYLWASAAKVLMFNTTQNYNQNMSYQIGAGDTVFQILDNDNNVLATVTETSAGAGEQKLKTLQLPWADQRMVFKIKNTSAQARIIKIGAVYAEVE